MFARLPAARVLQGLVLAVALGAVSTTFAQTTSGGARRPAAQALPELASTPADC